MYGFNALQTLPINGSLLQLIQIGQWQTWFVFSNNWLIQISNNCQLVLSDKTICEYSPDQTGWNSPEFQRIIGLKLLEYQIVNDDLMKLKFENSYEITLHDDDKKYEALLICGPNQEIYVV